MKTIKIRLNRKDNIKSMFSRTIIQQKSKIQSNKKLYNRQKEKYEKV